MAASLTSVTNPLANLSDQSEINWVDAVDQENSLHEPPKRVEIIKDGIKTVIDYIEDETTKKKSKVITTYKVITKKVPRVVAERKKWKKFGASSNDGPGPNINTTYVADEVEITFLHNRFREPDELLLDEKRNVGKTQTKGAHCRLCKSDEHWSTQCPYKEHFKEVEGEESDANEKSISRAGQTGRYVAPGMRNGERSTVVGSERPSDDTTVRITNLPEDSDTLDEDLRALFQSAGRITRSYVARDKNTNKPKGFAFITFSNRMEAENAIRRFNSAKFEHLILKVEWTKPSN